MDPSIYLDRYKLIEDATNKELARLPKHHSKALKISEALDRLFVCVLKLNPENENSDFVKSKKNLLGHITINPNEISKIDLGTFRAMLDAKISTWESEIEPYTEQGMEFNGRRAGFSDQLSLATALNIAQNNLFNFAGGNWGPLWGKADALIHVENALWLK